MKTVILNTADPVAGTHDATAVTRTVSEKVIGAVMDPFTMADNELAEKRDVQYVAAAYGLGGFVAGSMIARRRQAAGKAPFLKVIG